MAHAPYQHGHPGVPHRDDRERRFAGPNLIALWIIWAGVRAARSERKVIEESPKG